MSEDRDNRRDEDDDDLQELKRRRSRRDDDGEPKLHGRRKQRPEIKEFSVLADFGKFLSQITYTAPEGYTEEDVEDFIYDKKDDGLKTYSKSKPGRDKRGYDDRGGRRYDRDRY